MRCSRWRPCRRIGKPGDPLGKLCVAVLAAIVSAWQNWIFSRPNAVAEHGALKGYGRGEKSRFDRERV